MLASSLTTEAKIVLLAVAIAFIVFSLVSAITIPKRSPNFPGKSLNTYIVVVALFFVAQLGAVWWATSQEVEEAHAESPPVTTIPETSPGETTAPTETGGTETTPAGEGDPVAGKNVYASAGCGSCHTLADAGSKGAVGPNLDELKPTYDQVATIVTNGRKAMPSFKGSLSEEQIADVSAYVSSVAGT